MFPHRVRQTLAIGGRLALGAVFIYASYDKLNGSQLFVDAVENYRILPRMLLYPFAVILPWVQLVTGVCLVAGALVPGAALVSAGLYAMFMAAMASAIIRGLDISCGCFNLTDEGQRVAWGSLWPRALGMIASIYVMAASNELEWPLSRLVGSGKGNGKETSECR
ncbi:MAG: hypothetical protein KatS3mg024_1603 [Armatimonadota bacterium]|nr:MAG: hypothetical protein KatS3mg024_1603 [Armatimonadota bacterium]